MKKILLMATAALAIAGCSQNEEFENPARNVEISFSPVVKNSTRAAILDDDVLKVKGFKAYAYNVGTDGTGALSKPVLGAGVEVKYETDAWKYTGTYYWPSDTQVKFFAYAPASSTAAIYSIATPDTDTAPTISYTVPSTSADQEDLVAAVTAPLAYADGGVTLAFDHLLTQVNFSAKGQDALTYTLTSLEITGVAGTGTYNWTQWTVNGTAGKYTYPIASPSVEIKNSSVENLAQPDGALMLLPQEFAESSSAKVVVNYTVKDANGDLIYSARNKEVPLAKTTAWTKGQKVRYTLTLTNDAKPVSFGSVTVNPWNNDDDVKEEI